MRTITVLILLIFTTVVFAQNSQKEFTEADIKKVIRFTEVMNTLDTLSESEQVELITKEKFDTEEFQNTLIKIGMNYAFFYGEEKLSAKMLDDIYKQTPHLKLTSKEKALIEKYKTELGTLFDAM
jgi:hypothetical protein